MRGGRGDALASLLTLNTMLDLTLRHCPSPEVVAPKVNATWAPLRGAFRINIASVSYSPAGLPGDLLRRRIMG